jgi:2,3-bisphosphoglycerate-dependent phosphoglycerate mutase
MYADSEVPLGREPNLKTLVLLRHGESTWNHAHRFTGWTDVPLTARGEEQARRAGEQLAEAGFRPQLCFTSLLRRGTDSLRLALPAMGVASVPVVESWYLNERHFGALQGLGRLEALLRFGLRSVWACQRRYAAVPPPLRAEDPRHPAHDPRYAGLDARELPAAESLHDTVERMRPFWKGTLAPELRRGTQVLVVAHKNSLRALLRLLGAVREDEVPRLAIRTGRPLAVSLRDDLSVSSHRYLDDPAPRDAFASLSAGAAAVRRAS